jgi:hypothetical protein
MKGIDRFNKVEALEEAGAFAPACFAGSPLWTKLEPGSYPQAGLSASQIDCLYLNL